MWCAIVVIAVKIAAYSLAARVISWAYGQSELSSLLVGGTRVLIGLVTGVIHVLVMHKIFHIEGPVDVGTFWLIPVRMFDWWLLVWIFYDRWLTKPVLGWKVAILGTLWSYVLDFVFGSDLGLTILMVGR
jgi:hypothetical protein